MLTHTFPLAVRAMLTSITCDGSYVPSLERIVVLRLLAQLSSVYHTVTLAKLEVSMLIRNALSLLCVPCRRIFTHTPLTDEHAVPEHR